MHKLQMYENLRDMLEREVKAIEKQGDLDAQSLDHLFKLMTSIKNTDKCIAYEKGEEGGMSNGMGGMSNNSYGYSNRGNSYGNNSYDGMSNNMSNDYSNRMPYMSYDNSYGQGGSYDGMSNDGRRGRDGDSDGRYSEDNFRYSQDRGQSYESSYGYSRDASKKKMVQKLETLMDDTMSEKERQAIMDCISKIK